MTILSFHFGPNQIYGIEVSLFKFDDLDMAINSWEILAAKVMAKVFGVNLIFMSVEISDSRITLAICNCYLSLFWG